MALRFIVNFNNKRVLNSNLVKYSVYFDRNISNSSVKNVVALRSKKLQSKNVKVRFFGN